MDTLDEIKNINTLPEEHLTDEMSRRMIVGNSQMLTIWRMKKGAHSARHQHPEEQIFWILSGSVEFEIGGKRRKCGPGDVGVIPGNTPHEAWIHEDVEMANLFSPVRNDYLTQGALAYMKG
jgi:quercetin dioxygenase-like cupin family protein